MLIAVGSNNPAKLKAARMAVRKIFPKAEIIGVDVASGVANQPMSDAESIKGAINRAKRAISKVRGATYGIGMEGGVSSVARSGSAGQFWFDCGWIAVVDKNGKVGIGSSGRFQVANKVMKRVLKGEELGVTFDEVTGIKNTKHKEGAMGIVTNGHLPRATAYSHGILFAFGPFVSDKKFWD